MGTIGTVGSLRQREQSPTANWEQFKEAVIQRFEPGSMQNLYGPLLSLRQTRTVLEYRDRFEMVSSLLKAADWTMLRGILINGLKEETQAELKLHNSRSLSKLMDLALLIEEMNAAFRKGGTIVEHRKGGKDQGDPITKTILMGEYNKVKENILKSELGSKAVTEPRVTEGGNGDKKGSIGKRLTHAEI
ncbi:hypothetical protein CR513_53823, partial [Mucuna pruriens]